MYIDYYRYNSCRIEIKLKTAGHTKPFVHKTASTERKNRKIK